jgi:hypothetical protein
MPISSALITTSNGPEGSSPAVRRAVSLLVMITNGTASASRFSASVTPG